MAKKVPFAKDILSILDSAAVGIIILDKTKKIISINSLAQQIFGYSADELIGGGFEKLFPVRLRAKQIKKLDRILGSPKSKVELDNWREVAGLRSNKEEFNLELSVSRTEINAKTFLVLTLRDTSEVANENELVRAYARLLERSNQELQEFAYVASHDLQEPLRVISSYLQLLQSRYAGKLDEKADTFINFAVEASERMQMLISGMLELSRIGTRGTDLKLTDLNLPLDDALNNLRAAIAESNAKVTRQELPQMPMDRTQIATLFQNLISNSLKFKSNSTMNIEITAARENGMWVIGVQDNGIGIEPQYFDRIFTIFQRLHTREEFSGTGIGLAIAKKIVDRHGGEIWVKSKFGKGSTFYFSFPEQEEISSLGQGSVQANDNRIESMDESTLIERAKELI